MNFAARQAAGLGLHPDGRRLSIALYLHDMSGGGAERMRLALIDEFDRAGAEVTLLLHAAHGDMLPHLPAHIPVHAFGTRRTAADLLPLTAYLRRHRPDILLSSLDHNNLLAATAGAFSGGHTRVLLTQHNALSQELALGWKYRLMPWAYRQLAPWTQGFVCVSEGVADDLADTCGLERGQMSVIYNPVIGRDFAARAGEKLEHPWFAPGQPPVFISAGRLVPQKDFATLLHAFAIYRSSQPGRLMILGAGPLLGPLRSLADKLGVGDQVAFLGFQKNPLPWLRRAAAFLLASRYEGFGNVLVEALGCGLPVVATDCPYGPAEILAGGRFGDLVRVGDAEAMAACMDTELREKFPAAAARARAAQFSSQSAGARHLRLMRQVLGWPVSGDAETTRLPIHNTYGMIVP